MPRYDVIVIGAGIAGLASAFHLSARGLSVCLLEGEPFVAAHSSGRNAAIFRPLEEDATSAELTRRTLRQLPSLAPFTEGQPLLHHSGLWLVGAEASRIDAVHRHGRRQGVECERVGREELWRRQPLLEAGETEHGIWVPAGGVLDIHALTMALARAARAHGAMIRLSSPVEAVRVHDGRVRGVTVAGPAEAGEHFDAAHVVLAAGAWNAMLARSCGAALPLTPYRRHLVQLQAGAGASANDERGSAPEPAPTVWRLDDEIYVRPESAGFLASPCDQTAWLPGVPATDPGVLERLADKLGRLAPALGNARVRTAWACLRTFAPDRELVVGPDPRLWGLHWLTGLGGRGMACALGAAQELAAAIVGEPLHDVGATMLPRRLLSDASREGLMQ